MSNEPASGAAGADETDCEYYDDEENMLYEIDNEIEDDDNDEDNYFENIIKEVISGQDIDANNNQLISNKLLQQLQQPLNHQQHQQQHQQLSTDSTQVIKVSEDDLIDQRDSLRTLFKTEVLDRYECRCDTNQGLFITKQAKLSKSLQRKLANFYQLLHHFQLQTTPQTAAVAAMAQQSESPAGGQITVILSQSVQNQEYKKKLFRSLRSIVERVLIDALMICDQYHSQLQQQEQQLQSNTSNSSNNQPSTMSSASAAAAATSQSQANNPTTKLWCEIRSRGCQFLGPQMQDDVLRLILHALETVTRMSRKVLVLYVVHMLKKHYPKASKTSVGHVVQLLYRAGCFKVEKRENDSSLMELKKEFSKYQALRRQHDTQIIQIALESGIRMSPEQWSQKLFGDSNHKSEMQSIIDKLQSQQTLEKLIADFYDKLSTNLMTTTVGSASSSPSSSFSVHTNAHTQLALQQRNSNSSSSSSSSSASSQSSSSNTNSHLDVTISSLFLQVKAEFEFFAMINFEKKSPALSGANSSGKRNGELGSGGESLTSEDDESSFTSPDHDLNSFDFDDDFDSLTSKSYAKSIQQQQPEQAKIVWSLLLDCLKRSSKILASHIEYTTKMMSLIIANSNSNSINSSNTSSSSSSAAAAAAVTCASSTSNLNTLVNNANNRKQQQPLQRQIGFNNNNSNNSRFDYQDDEVNVQQHSFANSIARTLVAMGPNTQTNNFNRSKSFTPNNKNNQRNNINTNNNITKNKAANSNGFSFNATPSTAAAAAAATSIGSSNSKFNNNLFGSIYSSDFASNINLPPSAGLTKPPGFFQQQINSIFDSNILNNARGKNFFDSPKTINKPFYQQTTDNSSLFHHQSSPSYNNHFNKQSANTRNGAKHFSDE